jgi:mitochondrial-processing peptidase subunit beta
MSNASAVETTSLKNLVRVSSANVGGSHSTLGIFVNVGSTNECSSTNGLTNILASIANQESNPDEGVVISSFADREQFGILAVTPSDNVSGGLSALSRVFSSVVSGKNLDARKEEAVKALDDVDMNSQQFALDHLHSVAFQGTPLALPVSGNTESLKAISADSLKKFVATHFTGGRVVLAGAGNVPHSDLSSAAQNFLGNLPEKSDFHFHLVSPLEYTGSMVDVRDDNLPKLTAAVAMKSCGVTSNDYVNFLVLKKIVGEWNRNLGGSWFSTSKLVNSSIEEGHVLSSVAPFSLNYRSTGLFGVFASSTRDDVEDAFYHILKDWVRIAEMVTTTEVEKAKQKLIREILSNVSGTTGLARDLGLQLLQTGHYESPQQFAARVQRISRSDIRATATKYLTQNEPAVAVIGPTAFIPDYNQIRGWTYWNRL